MLMLIFVLNCGSSSIKSELIETAGARRLLEMQIENLGSASCRLLVGDERVLDAGGPGEPVGFGDEVELGAWGEHCGLTWARCNDAGIPAVVRRLTRRSPERNRAKEGVGACPII